MDNLEKSLSEELVRDMAAKSSLRANGNPAPKTVRLAEQIDLLIGDFKLRIDMLQKIKESL